jgi:hypothetical protein
MQMFNYADLEPKLMSLREVAEAFRLAMDEKKPISHVCVGDGEMYFLGNRKIPEFYEYPAGLALYCQFIPDYEHEVWDGVFHSDIIGAFFCQPGTISFFNHFPNVLAERNLCDGYIGNGLHFSGLLYDTVLKDKRVYLIGNKVQDLLPVLDKFQIELAGYTQANNFPDIPRIKECLSKTDFDLALLSAGILSLILGPWIKRSLGRCALDFGGAIYHVKDTVDFIGAKRDGNIFNLEATNGFGLPNEIAIHSTFG